MKKSYNHIPDVPPLPARNRFVGFSVAACVILSFILFNKFFTDFLHYSHRLPSDDGNVTLTPTTFEWGKVVPTPDLKWHACGVRRECARIELPMDHLYPDGEKIAVGLLRIPANTTSESEYRGPILLNPGGPRGSGVLFADEVGESLQQLIGPEYDIVGFDPRGVGATTPKVSFFLDNIERGLWAASAPPQVNSTSDAFERTLSRAEITGQLGFARAKHVAEYVGTASVARDMLNITNAFGFDKLKYWGFSYGTVLGGTFAAMFPDYVDRVIIDGVVEFSDYYSGRWYSNLLDTDKTVDYIFEACVAAGKDCPLHEPTPSQVGSRVHTILDSLKHHPVPVFNGTDYATLDYGSVKAVFFLGLYGPFQRIGPFFDALAALEKGNGIPMLAQLYDTGFIDAPPKCGDILESSVIPNSLVDGGTAVRCGEGYGVDTTLHGLQRYLDELRELSVFADIWSPLRIECARWEIKVKERYGGNFNETTSFPVLVIGNTLDPVAPLFAARKASEGFRNSVLLTVDTPGHGSLAAVSPVALKYVRDYFRDGTLPPVGTICPIEDKLFVKANSSIFTNPSLSKEDRELLELSKDLVRDMHKATKGLYL